MNKETQLMEQIGGSVIEKYELFKRQKVFGTPFDIVESEKGFFISLGQFRLSDFMEEDQCKDRVFTKDWELIFSVLTIFVEQLKKEENE